MADLNLILVDIEKPDDMNFILGQSHFIKTVEDLYEVIVNSVPNSKFGIAFCEASGDRKIRSIGNDEELKTLAEKNALNISAGHSFIIFLKDSFPLNFLNNIQNIPEICNIFCATANPTKIVVGESMHGKEKTRGILGVLDGYVPKGLENSDEIKWRHDFLRKIGYKK